MTGVSFLQHFPLQYRVKGICRIYGFAKDYAQSLVEVCFSYCYYHLKNIKILFQGFLLIKKRYMVTLEEHAMQRMVSNRQARLWSFGPTDM